MKLYLKNALKLVILATSFANAWAEEAPVYDVDSYFPESGGVVEAAAAPAAAGMPPTVARNMTQSADPQPVPQMMNPAPVAPLSMDQRVVKLEQQINNALQAEVGAKVDHLQTEIQNLQGQLEEITHQMQQMEAQQKTVFADLDKRINAAVALNVRPDKTQIAEVLSPAKNVKTIPKIKPSSALAKTEPQPDAAEEQKIYQTAYNFIKDKKYSQAANALQKMIKNYPTGQFASNAHFWLGELYGLMGKNELAVTEFSNVVNNYPESSKLADAQLKLGIIYAAQSKWVDAQSAFKAVLSKYPGTSSARLASEQLKQVKQAGH